ncbi:MAG TPA: hypothetical protein VG426_10110 [Candidatus Dormibacteraeota bacterium]|nr:hypothetical protein [Candidatus Dormibacteraeota bacterium]
MPLPRGAARPWQLGHALRVESTSDVACGKAAGRVHVEDAPDDWSDLLVDRDGTVGIPDVTAGDLADHLATLSRIAVRITDLLASHAALHGVGRSQRCICELASWRAVESTMDEDHLDLRALLHECVEVQSVGCVAEAARLVVGRNDADTTAFDPLDQREERFAALQFATADVEVTEDLDLVGGRHGRESAAMLLLDLGRDGPLALLVARLPDVDERHAGMR